MRYFLTAKVYSSCGRTELIVGYISISADLTIDLDIKQNSSGSKMSAC